MNAFVVTLGGESPNFDGRTKVILVIEIKMGFMCTAWMTFSRSEKCTEALRRETLRSGGVDLCNDGVPPSTVLLLARSYVRMSLH